MVRYGLIGRQIWSNRSSDMVELAHYNHLGNIWTIRTAAWEIVSRIINRFINGKVSYPIRGGISRAHEFQYKVLGAIKKPKARRMEFGQHHLFRWHEWDM